jgi:hypothetical protein
MKKNLQIQKEKANHTIVDEKKPKVSTSREHQEAKEGTLYSWKSIPISKAKIEKVKEAVRGYLTKYPKATSLSQVYRDEHIDRRTYYSLLKRDPELQELHEETERMIGERLYQQSVYAEANWTPVSWYIHKYGKEFAEVKEYNAALKAQENKNEMKEFPVIGIPESYFKKEEKK